MLVVGAEGFLYPWINLPSLSRASRTPDRAARSARSPSGCRLAYPVWARATNPCFAWSELFFCRSFPIRACDSQCAGGPAKHGQSHAQKHQSRTRVGHARGSVVITSPDPQAHRAGHIWATIKGITDSRSLKLPHGKAEVIAYGEIWIESVDRNNPPSERAEGADRTSNLVVQARDGDSLVTTAGADPEPRRSTRRLAFVYGRR